MLVFVLLFAEQGEQALCNPMEEQNLLLCRFPRLIWHLLAWSPTLLSNNSCAQVSLMYVP